MTVEIDNVRAIKETDKAVLCLIDDREVWVPRSQIDDDSNVYGDGHEGTLIVSDWFAKQEDLE